MSAKKPAAVKRLEGNPGQRPIQDEPEIGPPGMPDPPGWLQGEAFVEWARITTALSSVPGLLRIVDRAGLVAYCEAWGTFVEAAREVRERGVLVRGRDNSMVRNPAVQIARDAAKELKVWCAEFGFSPSARARMAVPAEGKDDGVDAEILSLVTGS